MIDLHVHSNVSDGTCSPAELVDMACDKGITVMALTDHDSVQGVSEALKRAEELRQQGKNWLKGRNYCAKRLQMY